MTEHRSRKLLIRDRMARTGESYSTARRQLLAARPAASGPALPAGILPGYDTFGGGQHRESTLLAHVLRQQGIAAPHTGKPFTEAMMCGLGGGIGFMYAVFEYKGYPPMLTIVAQHHPEPWAPAVLDRLDSAYTEEHSTSSKAALAALRAALDTGRPVWCTVTRSRLPWHAEAPDMHGLDAADPYPVVVAGADGDVLYLDDLDPAPLPMPAADLGAAWAAHRKGRHHRLVVTGAPRAGLADAVRAALATTVEHLTGPVLGNSFDGNFGFAGMAKLSAQLRDARGKTGWQRRFAAPEALALGLGRLADCLELEYTAPGATRPLYADFLDEAAEMVGGDRLPAAAKLFRESGEIWSHVADRASAAATSAAATSAAATSAAATSAAATSAAAPALFAELADLVDAARAVEERAVTLLAG
jgi:hypothetical protein